MVFRLAAGAVADVVIPYGLAKAGLFSGCPVVLGVVAASEEGSILQYCIHLRVPGRGLALHLQALPVLRVQV